MIKTKQELFSKLEMTKGDELDEIFTHKISIKVLRDVWEGIKEDDKYWSGLVKNREKLIREQRNEMSSLRSQVKSAIKRKDWWKKECRKEVKGE